MLTRGSSPVKSLLGAGARARLITTSVDFIRLHRRRTLNKAPLKSIKKGILNRYWEAASKLFI